LQRIVFLNFYLSPSQRLLQAEAQAYVRPSLPAVPWIFVPGDTRRGKRGQIHVCLEGVREEEWVGAGSFLSERS
jgi:hypothetical protein